MASGPIDDPPAGDLAPIRVRLRVHGIVQGVGFRPFVYAEATSRGLTGLVTNDVAGVVIEVQGDPAAVDDFRTAIESRPPSLAVVERVAWEPIDLADGDTFVIDASSTAGERTALVSPDVATCDDCLRELFDPSDRRHRFPFINCTNCGPRFTIARRVPYDRINTTMSAFAMCDACAAEYSDPRDRRFHAQPVCCWDCGPRLRLVRAGADAGPAGADAPPAEGDAMAAAAERLTAGDVVAVKGLGGYHLAVDATNEEATARLRSRKHREDRPFAVMVRDLDEARRLVDAGEGVIAELADPRAPIVIAPRRPDAVVTPSVAPRTLMIGVMLPYSPLHHLLSRAVGRPMVLTSGNVSDEPIAFRDDEALTRLTRIADWFLLHDRAIETRTDDSVVRLGGAGVVPIRRSRGFVPAPLRLPTRARKPILACGAELKSTFCLARGDRAFVSHHIGDLENLETMRSFTDGIEHLRRLHDVTPEIVAHDLHPEYLSTKYALDLADVDHVGVQHHHAHVAACLAENGRNGPAIGVAFDGLGFGTDGTLWGGEFLVASLERYERAGHLEQVRMPGGAAAIREPWRMAAAYLDAALGDAVPSELGVAARNAERWGNVVEMARREVNAPLTSSAGRLFDAVAAICGVRDAITYEGQAAVELEQLADASETRAYSVPFDDGAPFVARTTELVRRAVADVGGGAAVGLIAARFHNGLARAIVEGCLKVREQTGLRSVALSGGVFQNVVLLERSIALLEDAGFEVLVHRRVPPNDGGISLGQAAVAAATDAHGGLAPDRGAP